MKAIIRNLGQLVLLGWFLAGFCAFGEVGYTFTSLGTLGGNSFAFDINNRGQVIGESMIGEGADAAYHAFLYSDGIMQDLGRLGQWNSGAYGINDSGQVVGCYGDQEWNNIRAFLYSDGVIRDLGAPTEWGIAAYDINNGGQVVGWSDGHAFLYSEGVMHPLSGPDSVANAINDNGQVAGWFCGNAGRHAFLYSDGVIQDLGTLGGMKWGLESEATAISNNGNVAGCSGTASGVMHAFLYSDGVMQDLGTPGYSSGASGVNNMGQVVGWWYDWDFETWPYTHAFLYSDGVMVDLDTFAPPGWMFVHASAINDLGQIVGVGANPAGYGEAFLLTPIPEPGTVLLLGIGVVIVRRRAR
jgi:probable HAF family extracellular repeat protein